MDMRTMTHAEFWAFMENKRVTGPYLGYTQENEISWMLDDGSRVEITISYHEGCPTCGGDYEKEYVVYPPAKKKGEA